MKRYTKINSIKIATVFACLLIIPVSSCKKMNDDLNQDQKKLPYGAYVPGSYLTGMMQSIVKACPQWWQQVQQNLNADIYSGYMSTGTAFNNGTNNTTYFMMDGWNGFAASTPYDYVLNPWLDIKRQTFDSEKELYAISLIIKVMAAHRLTDIFGPVPYTQLGTSTSPAFDSQETLYKTFFSELKTAVDILTAAEDADPSIDQKKLAPYDCSSLGGDFKHWVQLANTLRLRLAIRVSEVDGGLAKIEGEAAVNHKYGVLESMPFTVLAGDCGSHYLYTISREWGDILLNADMECYLNGYKDPRAVKYALPATSPAAVKGKIKGIRNGIDVAKNNYKGFSQLNFNSGDRVLLITAAESDFLRAEGVIRGWNMGGGSAQSFYEQGITKSFDQYAVGGIAAYLADGTSTPTDYVDPVEPAYNEASPSNITIKWDDGASFDQKLERIITQKWIAMFPEGQEAWSEFRRTGYPKLFPVEVNNSGGQVAPGQFIRRLPYPSYFTTSNPSGVSDAVNKYLGGADKMGTALWWDKN
jgi:hypothetical protein